MAETWTILMLKFSSPGSIEIAGLLYCSFVALWRMIERNCSISSCLFVWWNWVSKFNKKNWLTLSLYIYINVSARCLLLYYGVNSADIASSICSFPAVHLWSWFIVYFVNIWKKNTQVVDITLNFPLSFKVNLVACYTAGQQVEGLILHLGHDSYQKFIWLALVIPAQEYKGQNCGPT